MHQKTVFFLCCFFLALGFFLEWQIRGASLASQHDPSACSVAPIREEGYQFIRPLLLCEVSSEQSFSEFTPLKNKISDYVQGLKKSKNITKVSVYFRDYRLGKWLYVNENEQYAPASLVKVPVMIAYLRFAQSHPEIFSKTLRFEEKQNYNELEHFLSPNVIKPYKSYTIEELLGKMIKYSDNNAYFLLINNIDNDLLDEVFTDLGLRPPPPQVSPDRIDFITVKSYAYFFRVLFNATYISREFSEKAFHWLSQSDFHLGLVAGTPGDLTVAHKFGEIVLPGNTGLRELHDCGIVYYPSRPYLLCIMTQGYDFEKLIETIQTIARFAYDEIGNSAMP